MFLTVVSCGLTNNEKLKGTFIPIEHGAAALDLVVGVALLVFGSLIASGVFSCSPAAAYAMIGVGSALLSPLLLISGKKLFFDCCHKEEL